MKGIKESLRALVRTPAFPLLCLGFVLAVAHLFFDTGLGDDKWFAEQLAGERATLENWVAFLQQRYQTWSSRIAIEGALVLCARYPLIWRVADALICIAVIAMISNLVNPERSRTKNIIICICTFLFPLRILWETGFLATTINYLWPLAAALAVLTPTIKTFLGREIYRYEYIIAFPSLLFACFQELLCATLVLLFLSAIVYRIVWTRKIPIYEIGCTVICVGMLLFALGCPGNDARFLQESAMRLPRFAELNFAQRFELGFSSTAKKLFLDLNVFVFLFCLLTTVSVIACTKNVWKRVVSILPTVFVLAVGLLGGLLSRFIPGIGALRASVGELGTEIDLSVPVSLLPDLIFAVIIFTIFLSLRFAIKDTRMYVMFTVLLLIGASSRIAMGFSPTVWVSGERTFTFFYFVMAIVVGYLIDKLIPKAEQSLQQSTREQE